MIIVMLLNPLLAVGFSRLTGMNHSCGFRRSNFSNITVSNSLVEESFTANGATEARNTIGRFEFPLKLVVVCEFGIYMVISSALLVRLRYYSLFATSFNA